MTVGFSMLYKLQLSLTTVPANLGSLASGWTLEHGNSLFPAGMSEGKHFVKFDCADDNDTQFSNKHDIEYDFSQIK